jgi:hypothetical protein
MKRIGKGLARSALAAAFLGWIGTGAVSAQEFSSPLTLTTDTGRAHIMPLPGDAGMMSNLAGDPGPLLYHGGPIMQSTTIYPIFWIPSKLQNGGATGFSSKYALVQIKMLNDYIGHGVGNINTQYSQTSPTAYVQNKGGLGGFYIDSTAYPASGCTDTATPGNCLSDAQLQTEISNVMAIKGWTGGLSKIFMLFTSSGEGSCLTTGICAYTFYCAYHDFFGPTATPIIYSNEPYGNTSVCQAPGTPTPNGDAIADTAATAASHELSEAITDPELTAWYTALGNENGDLCAYDYGTNTWDGGLANQMWNGDFFELQMEFNNHTSSCAQVGP